jgi:hypothetical protein
LDIGKLTKIKIKPEDITSEENTELRDKLFFSVDYDFTDQSYFLVLGGYLVFPDAEIFHRTGDHVFTLNMRKICYLERLYESLRYINLSSLNLAEFSQNSEIIYAEEAWSDAVIKRYFTLSQSFLVAVDCPLLTVTKRYIRKSPWPGAFTTYKDPQYPLIIGYGKLGEYWKVHEDGYWACNVVDSYYRNYVFSETQTSQLNSITPNMIPSKPYFHGRGYLLEIGGYK